MNYIFDMTGGKWLVQYYKYSDEKRDDSIY